jgi:hypothetical protein
VLDATLVGEISGRRHERMADTTTTMTVGDDHVHQLHHATLGQRVRAVLPQHRHAGGSSVDGDDHHPAVGIGDRGGEPVGEVRHRRRVDRSFSAATDLPQLAPQTSQGRDVADRRGPRDHGRTSHERSSGPRPAGGTPRCRPAR